MVPPLPSAMGELETSLEEENVENPYDEIPAGKSIVHQQYRNGHFPNVEIHNNPFVTRGSEIQPITERNMTLTQIECT